MLPDEPISDQSFLGRVFDSYQNMMQIARCIREAARQMSVARPRVLELSRRETGIQQDLAEADVVRHSTHKNDAVTLTFPVTLPFADRSFDACLVTDAYEHVPQHLRSSLLSEMLRVTNGLVLVGCPNGNEVVSRFDKLVFDFIWGKYSERFRPLEQHAEFGLESPEQIVGRLKEQGADHITVLPANYVYRWIHMILVYFDLQHNNHHGELFEPFNRIYNQYISPYDYREPCYRYLLAISNHPALDVKEFRLLKPPDRKRLSTNELDELVAQTFRNIDSAAADQLRECSTEIGRLQSLLLEAAKKDRILAEREETICLCNEEIERLRASLLDSELGRLEIANNQASLELLIEEKEQARQAVSARLAATESSLASMTNSLAWRLVSRYGKIKYRYLLPVYRILGLPYREHAETDRKVD
jgi:hypothetical protein